MSWPTGNPLELTGNPRQRGLAQAALAADEHEDVRNAVYSRLAPVERQLASPGIADWLKAQQEYAFAAAPDELDELVGISEGYGIPLGDLFAYLHLGIIHDMIVRPAATADGCTAWAARTAGYGAVVAKNRDFRGEHTGLQRVFRHEDPAWGGRRVLCVGSLGSPGAYSSGVNSDGLVIADTQIGTSAHGVGLLRYFVMTRLLTRAKTVSQALDQLSTVRHAGGGSIVMADAAGDIAAVELGHRKIATDRNGGHWVARTNHFLSSALTPVYQASAGDPMAVSSIGRLKTVRAAIADWLGKGLTEASALMASHDSGSEGPETGRIGLCRHGEDGDSRTISTSLFTCAPPRLYFCGGNPCEGEWVTYKP